MNKIFCPNCELITFNNTSSASICIECNLAISYFVENCFYISFNRDFISFRYGTITLSHLNNSGDYSNFVIDAYDIHKNISSQECINDLFDLYLNFVSNLHMI